MKRIPLSIQIIFGLMIGVIWALLSAHFGFNQFTLNWIAPWGSIFVNLLKLIAVPLVLFSIIKGISGLKDIGVLGKLGAKTLLAYVLTTVIAVTIGLLTVNILEPGKSIDETQRIENRKEYERFVYANPDVSFKDDIRLLEEDQIAGFKNENESVNEKLALAKSHKESGPLQFLVDMVPSNIFFSLNNNGLLLQVIFFAIFFGVCSIMLDRTITEPLDKVVNALNEIFLKMVDIVMKGAPFFVFALLAGKIAELANSIPEVLELFKGLGWYSLTVVIGLFIVAFVIYPLILTLLVKRINFLEFFKRIGPAQVLAFSTSSSAATLPVTMDCVRDRIGVSKGITSFVLPIGATVNMDGTSLYLSVAVVFLAQFHMVDLSLAQQLTIVLTATLSSIGAAAVPSAGIVMLVMVLASVGLDGAWIAIILPVDRILDMCRTVVNVTGDATVATLIGKSEDELKVPQL